MRSTNSYAIDTDIFTNQQNLYSWLWKPAKTPFDLNFVPVFGKFASSEVALTGYHGCKVTTLEYQPVENVVFDKRLYVCIPATQG